MRSFETHFQSFRREKIVIYGLGPNTGILVEAMRERYHIVGLMDGARTGDTVYGLPVLSIDEVHALGVKCILVLARAGNVPIIFARIAKACERFGIDAFDINGERLVMAPAFTYEMPLLYREITREHLLDAVRAAEVVSFDIFDTLLMRRVLQPTDVFLILECLAESEGVLQRGSSFAKDRQVAEHALYADGRQPSLREIYQRLIEDAGYGWETAQWLMHREMEEEERQLFARRPVVDILRQALAMGKEVCCTSDMYLSSAFVYRIFEREQIPAVSLLISCEQGTSKGTGLFPLLKKRYAGKRILHIGDNEKVDIDSAKRNGIRAFFLPSAVRMLADSRESELLSFQQTLSNRLTVGGFLGRVFEDPFLFAETEGRARITSPEELGAVFIEPMLASFCDWLISTCERAGVKQLLLGARDGWLITKMLDAIALERQLPFTYRYIYVSRAACTLAGMDDVQDVLYAGSLAFAGSAEELLQKRFRLAQEQILPRQDQESDADYLKRHAPLILAAVPRYRGYYRQYLRQAGVRAEERTAFFDFVSSGTCQLWLEKILGMPLLGCYFLQIHDEYKAKLAIRSFYPKLDVVYRKAQCRLAKSYFFMENVMSDVRSSLAYVGEGGKPFFEREGRSKEKLSDLSAIHAGVMRAFHERLHSSIGMPEKELADDILSYVNREKSELCIDYFHQNILEDGYCNRSFSIDSMV